MNPSDKISNHFVKMLALAMLALFLLPILTLGFVRFEQANFDRKVTPGLERQLARAHISEEDRQNISSLYSNYRPSRACGISSRDIAADARALDYQSAFCKSGAQNWQFYYMGQLSLWLIIGGIVLMLVIFTLGAIAFTNRRAQYASLMAGWRLLVAVGAVEIIAQGVILVWLSFWLTAYFLHIYAPKLILLVAVFVFLGMVYAISCLFKRLPPRDPVEGEVLTRFDAPELWSRIEALAKRAGTQPPDQIISGIDDNFYVTEVPITVGNQTLEGRTLYISIPLLRILQTDEADSVLVHELGHLRGGDTKSSALLAPRLDQFDLYIYMMYDNHATRPVYYLLNFYRLIFELALKRESRQREYLADQAAASLVSPQAIIHSLIKIAAYSNYRARIEEQLFAREFKNEGELGIAARVAQGLGDYAQSNDFSQDMRSRGVPHPFDSHPALTERMRNVNCIVPDTQYGAIATQTPQQSWVDLIPTAAHIEERLWTKYEQAFEENHGLALAYRYEPATPEEEQIVNQYFPPVTFTLKHDESVEINAKGLVQPKTHELISWDAFKSIQYSDGAFSDTLLITHPNKSFTGSKSSIVKLPGFKKNRAAFKETLGKYWQRHEIMRAQQAERNTAQVSGTSSEPQTARN